MFAVAFAVSLLFGDDHTSCVCRQNMMQGHLKHCLQSEHFIPLLASAKAKRKLMTIGFKVVVMEIKWLESL